MNSRIRKENFRPINETIELEYANFYTDLLKTFYNFENPQIVKRIKKSLHKTIQIKLSEKSVKKVPGGEIQYFKKENRCAYIYRYSVLHTKMVSFHFTSFLMECTRIAKHILKNNILRICCLGGGPGLEAVAIVKVLNDLMVNVPSARTTDIHITVVDKCSKWEEECLAILEKMKQNEDLVISKHLNINIEYLKANLLIEFDDNIKKKIMEADILTMVKFVSELDKLLPDKTSGTIRNVIQNVANCMKDKGYFFMADNGGGGIPYEFRSVFCGNTMWRRLYSVASHERHCLQNDTLQIFEDLLPGSRCSKETLVYSCVWMKQTPDIRQEVNMSSDKDDNVMCYIEFYKDVLNSLYDFKDPQNLKVVTESLAKLRELKPPQKNLTTISSEGMDYSLNEDRCAYIYFYCLLHSKMVSDHFKEFLKEDTLIQKNLTKMSNFRICCLSEGVGIDVVAMVKFINDLGLESSSREPLNLEITVVNKYSEWGRESLQMLNAIKEHPSLNITRKINIHADFIKGNVHGTLDNILKEKIRKTDFVIMVKFARDVQLLFRKKARSRIRKIIKSVTDCMGVGGCFFIVDNGRRGLPSDVRRVFRDKPLWTNIYESKKHVTHTLGYDTIQKMANCFLCGSCCSKETNVFCQAWIKDEPDNAKMNVTENYSHEDFKKNSKK